MSKLEDIIQSATYSFRQPFIESRYPYTYAYDFLKSHPELVPVRHVDAYFAGSRALTSVIVRRWAEDEEIDHDQLVRVLADAYMKEHHIHRPC